MTLVDITDDGYIKPNLCKEDIKAIKTLKGFSKKLLLMNRESLRKTIYLIDLVLNEKHSKSKRTK